MSYQTGKLYEASISRRSDLVAIRLAGESLSVKIYGSESKPASISDMTDVRAPTESDPITDPGYYSFHTLPRFIAFVGTAPVIETINYVLSERGDIA